MKKIINALLLDDDLEDIQKFEEDAQLPEHVQLKTVLVKLASGADSLERMVERVTQAQPPVNLLFIDLSLDPSRESDPTGIELLRQLEVHYQGQMPFGVAFVTRYDNIFATNLLVEMVSPTTLCGFVKKWGMHYPSRTFAEMVGMVIANFEKKFSWRLASRDGFEEYDIAGSYDWFCNGYLDDYLNRTFRVATLHESLLLRIPLRNILAFERLSGRNALAKVHYLPNGESVLQCSEVDYYFEDLCTALADLDFRPNESVEEGERNKQESEANRLRPFVFARFSRDFLVNMQYPEWSLTSIKVDESGKPSYGHGALIQSQHRNSKKMPIYVRAHRDCNWAGPMLKWLFGKKI